MAAKGVSIFCLSAETFLYHFGLFSSRRAIKLGVIERRVASRTEQIKETEIAETAKKIKRNIF